jgi:hypothetical protein
VSPIAPGLVSISTTTIAGTYKDLADFNFVVENWPDILSGPLPEYVEGTRPGRVDTARLDDYPRFRPAEFQVVGTVYARSSGYSVSSMLTDLRSLKGWCARAAYLKVNTLDSAMVREARLVGVTAQDIGVVGGTAAMRVSLSFKGHDPLWYSTSETSNAITTSFSAQALGTAPVWPVVTVTGNPSALTLTYADSAGATVQTLTLTGLVTSGATSTVIDMNRHTVTQVIAAVSANAIEYLDTATHFFALDPAHGDYSVIASPAHPQLKYSATGSVSSVACVYRKAYY